MRLLAWVVRGFVLFTLFAFALNNEHPAVVHWFFGYHWRAPMVIVVMAALGVGVVAGVAAMSLPRLRLRLGRRGGAPAAPAPSATHATTTAAAAGVPASTRPASADESAFAHPPRVGL